MGAFLRRAYLDSIILIERLHRQFLDVLKAELERMGVKDINNVQSLILFNVGDDEVTVGELTARGYYLGSNVSYNLKKMVENGYLIQERSPQDRRAMRIRLSEKGRDLAGRISQLFDDHAEALGENHLDAETVQEANTSLRELERFWAQRLIDPAPLRER